MAANFIIGHCVGGPWLHREKKPDMMTFKEKLALANTIYRKVFGLTLFDIKELIHHLIMLPGHGDKLVQPNLEYWQ